MTRPRVLMYCQHSVGLGHLVRSLHLAEGLADEFDVTLLNGGPWPAQLPQPTRVDVVHLPALGLEGSALVSRDERFTVEDAVPLRRELVMAAFRDTEPDVLLVELFPFGRKHFAGELLPVLEAARTSSDERARELAAAGADLLSAAAGVRSGEPVERAQVDLARGSLVIVTDGPRAAVATTVAQPTSALVALDLRTVLRRVAQETG